MTTDSTDSPFQENTIVELSISQMDPSGTGISIVDGWPVHVPFALPDELVEAKVWRNCKDHSKADLIKVIEASPNRVVAECKFYQECSGCQLQHLDYQSQLELKHAFIVELFKDFCDVAVEPVIGSPKQFEYRSKITPHFQKPRNDKPLDIGFTNVYQRHKVTDVDHCVIATSDINTEYKLLRKTIESNRESFKKGVTLLLRQNDNGVEIDARKVVEETINGVTYKFKAGDFFQNNPYILSPFVDYVASQAQGPGLSYLLDTYCGAGLFALGLADKFKQVVGIEISEQAITLARVAAQDNSIDNTSFIANSAEHIFDDLRLDPKQTAVIVDPPRKGASESFIKQILDYSPQRIVYVSCNPQSQRADLEQIVNNQYAVEKIQPFDFFPHTRHIENVVTLSLLGPESQQQNF